MSLKDKIDFHEAHPRSHKKDPTGMIYATLKGEIDGWIMVNPELLKHDLEEGYKMMYEQLKANEQRNQACIEQLKKEAIGLYVNDTKVGNLNPELFNKKPDDID